MPRPSFVIFMTISPRIHPFTPSVSVKNWCKTIGLDELPYKGHIVPELNEDAVRELWLYSYRVIYEIKPDHLIEVLAVIHKRRHVDPDDIPRE